MSAPSSARGQPGARHHRCPWRPEGASGLDRRFWSVVEAGIPRARQWKESLPAPETLDIHTVYVQYLYSTVLIGFTYDCRASSFALFPRRSRGTSLRPSRRALADCPAGAQPADRKARTRDRRRALSPQPATRWSSCRRPGDAAARAPSAGRTSAAVEAAQRAARGETGHLTNRVHRKRCQHPDPRGSAAF